MMTNRFLACVVAAISAVAVVVSLAIFLPQKSVRPIPLVISRFLPSQSGLIDIALSKGFFAAEGLAVTLQNPMSGIVAINTVLDGKADIGAATESPIAQAIVNGTQIKVIATIYTGGGCCIIVRQDRGIINPSDLKGRRLGIVPGTMSQHLFDGFLAFHRIPRESVDFVDVLPDQMMSSLMAGTVDAISIWPPYAYHTKHPADVDIRYFSADKIHLVHHNLIIRADYLLQNREAIDRLLRALIKAEVAVSTDPDDALRILSLASGTAISDLRKNWDPLSYKVTLDQSLVLSAENENRWITGRDPGVRSSVSDFLHALEPGPLRALRPSSVSIVK